MSLLKHILSPFVEFEEAKKKEAPDKNTPATVRNYNAPLTADAEHPLLKDSDVTTPANTGAATPSNRMTATILPEHEEYFEKLIEEANQKIPLFQGTDFKEFIDSKTDISNIADEETKYRTAFNVLKRTGLTKEKLLSTAQEYHDIIGRDLNAFQSAHAQKYRKDLGQREQLIQNKAEELQALSQRVAALKKEISELSNEMVDTKEKLNLTKNSFLLAGENKQVEIQNELRKIEKYF